jgi:hypothetical protein
LYPFRVATLEEHSVVLGLEVCVSEQLQRLHNVLLKMLSEAKGRKLARSDFKPKGTDRKKLGIDEAAVEKARALLVQEGYVSEKKRANGASYELLDRGAKYVAALPGEEMGVLPRPLQLNEDLLPVQKAFLLLVLFRAPDRTLKAGDLRQKLKTKAAMLRLGFASIPFEVAEDFRPSPDAAVVQWVADQLVRQGAVRERSTGAGTNYTLTETGIELLAATEQYGVDDISCGLSLRELNELLAAARHGSLTRAHELVSAAPPPGPLTQSNVLRAFDDLRRDERFAGEGIVPIYELRRSLTERYGLAAGSHEVLDPLLFELRREKRLRMVAIGDPSRATREQLNASVPGENEIFFTVEAAREYASSLS